MSLWTKLAHYSLFETERMVLRPFSYEDREAFYQIVGVDAALPFVFPSRASQEEATELLVSFFLKNPLGKWAVVDKRSQQLIGALSFEMISEKKAVAEIGYFLSRTYWGQGLMCEALKTVSYLALAHMDFKELTLMTHLENKASQQVAKKAGYQFVKQYKGSDRYTHQMRDYLQFQFTKKELYKMLKEEE
ncbi:GNAT family N-acetyltransferase [Streptococcus cameli]